MEPVTPAATTGTTPDVLQHYLTAGITVRHLNFHFERTLGLGNLHAEGLLFDSMWKWEYADVLPVLRPFSALCDPLPDGTVPAVEFVKLGGRWGDEGVTLATLANPDLIHLTVNGQTEGLLARKHIENCTSRQADYLRSQHFALPVNGRPLVEGVDFIAK